MKEYISLPVRVCKVSETVLEVEALVDVFTIKEEFFDDPISNMKVKAEEESVTSFYRVPAEFITKVVMLTGSSIPQGIL